MVPEPDLKTRKSLTLILYTLGLSIVMITSACSTAQEFGPSAPNAVGNGDAQAAPPESQSPELAPAPQDLPASSQSYTPEGMVAFEGTIYVALTEPIESRWQSAGWRISDQPLDTDAQQAPADCSLYPHSGVQNQWVGACRGYVLVPQDGADHIAVMITNPDGSFTPVQIAPPPAP